MIQTTMTRAYALGLGYGNIWLVSACLGFGILDMFTINTSLQMALFSVAGLLLIWGVLLYLCVRLLRLGYQLPRSTKGKISRLGIRIFSGLVLLEIIGWCVIDALLATHGLTVWLVPVDLFIVGAHFIPLAFVFKVPAYLVMGILWLIAIVVSMLLLPPTTIIGHGSAWFTVPSICCIVITWLTALYLTTSAFKRLRLATQIA